MKMPNLQRKSQNVTKVICFATTWGGYLFMKGSVYIKEQNGELSSMAIDRS